MKAKWTNKHKTVCKEWIVMHKEKRLRDMIYKLRKTDEVGRSGHVVYTTVSHKMAEIGRKHHARLQDDRIEVEDDNFEKRHNRIRDALR
jgi:hypothetical protein